MLLTGNRASKPRSWISFYCSAVPNARIYLPCSYIPAWDLPDRLLSDDFLSKRHLCFSCAARKLLQSGLEPQRPVARQANIRRLLAYFSSTCLQLFTAVVAPRRCTQNQTGEVVQQQKLDKRSIVILSDAKMLAHKISWIWIILIRSAFNLQRSMSARFMSRGWWTKLQLRNDLLGCGCTT